MPSGLTARPCGLILDTTAIIHVHRNRAQDRVRQLNFRFACPQAVADEFMFGSRSGGSFRAQFPWLSVVPNTASPRPLADGLGRGEQMAILECYRDRGSHVLVSDDNLARKVASRERVCTIDSRALFSMVHARGLSTVPEFLSNLRSVLGLGRVR